MDSPNGFMTIKKLSLGSAKVVTSGNGTGKVSVLAVMDYQISGWPSSTPSDPAILSLFAVSKLLSCIKDQDLSYPVSLPISSQNSTLPALPTAPDTSNPKV
jgi:hypothetical protein